MSNTTQTILQRCADGFLQTELWTITPEIAQEILDNHNWQNRKPNEYHINRLAADFEAGRARLSNDMICFAPNTRLINGQHRLYAVVKSGVPVQFIVAFAMPEESMRTMDAQINVRTVLHAAEVEGIDFGPGAERIKAFARMIRTHGGKARISTSRDEDVDYIKQHHVALSEIAAIFPHQKGLGKGAVGGVLVRALLSRPDDAERIKLFLKVYREGVCDFDNTLIEPRLQNNALILRRKCTQSDTSGERRNVELYMLTEKILFNTLEGKEVKNASIPVQQPEYFPLEGDVLTILTLPSATAKKRKKAKYVGA